MGDFGSSGAVKVCTSCHVEKPLSEFYLRRRYTLRSPGTYEPRCRRCCCAKVKAYAARNREKVKAYKKAWYRRADSAMHAQWSRASSYRRLYDQTHAAYDLQLQAQNGCCAICLRKMQPDERRFALDHDHATGLMRGILCSNCNNGLGCFKDRPALLRAALTYLIEWTERHERESEAISA